MIKVRRTGIDSPSKIQIVWKPEDIIFVLSTNKPWETFRIKNKYTEASQKVAAVETELTLFHKHLVAAWLCPQSSTNNDTTSTALYMM